MPLTVQRFYNSLLRKWRFSGFDSLLIDLPNNKIEWHRDDGKAFTFTQQSGGWGAQGYPSFSLSVSGSQWVLRDDSLTRYTSDTSGKIVSKMNSSGVAHAFSYDDGNTTTVTRNVGGSLIFEYDGTGRIVSVTRSDIDSYEYTYNGYDNILTAVFVDRDGGRHTRTYHYENEFFPYLLTGITDERGVRYVSWKYDAFQRASESVHGSIGARPDQTKFVFNDDSSTTVINPLFKRTTYRFIDVNGEKKISAVEGHETTNCAAANQAYSYYPDGHVNAGLLETKTDWQGRVTRYSYNERGLEATRVEAEGTSEERVTQTQWHATLPLPIRIADVHRVTSINYDVNGRVLNRNVVPVSVSGQ